MELDYDSFHQEYQLTLKGTMSHRLTLGTDPRGNIIRMDNALAGIPSRQENSKTQLENLYNQQESAKVEVSYFLLKMNYHRKVQDWQSLIPY